MFDAQAFLDASTTEATKTFLLPVGEYLFNVKPGSCKLATWESQDKSKSGWKLQYQLTTTDPTALTGSDRAEYDLRYEIMLDPNADGSPSLSSGGGLKAFREAIGLNVAGQPFSPRMAEGRALRARIKHRPAGDNIYAEVERVSRV